MSYRYSSEIVILNKLGLAEDLAKAELFETYDQLRDLTVSGPSIGGSGLGPAGGFLMKLAQMVSGSSFLPTLGNPSMNIPGTSYFSPIQAGTGIQGGGQSSFGLGPMSQFSGLPAAGSAAGFDAASILASVGTGNQSLNLGGIGAIGFPTEDISTGGIPSGSPGGGAASLSGTVGGGAANIGAGNASGIGLGLAAAAGFGRSLVLPAAGIVSGIGGLLTTLAPLLGPKSGLAGLATGTILSGVTGSVLAAYQHAGSRVLVNADTILSNKVKNLETVVKQLEAQDEIVKKLLKDSLEGDKKALQDL